MYATSLPDEAVAAYWSTIAHAARRTRRRRDQIGAVCVVALLCCCAYAGTCILPGLGTVCGGVIGLAISGALVCLIADTPETRVFSNILRMNHTTGIRYAKLLYETHGLVAYDDLTGDFMHRDWSGHVDLERLHGDAKNMSVAT